MKKKCYVTYTIAYCVEVELDIPDSVNLDELGHTDINSDIFEIVNANIDIINDLEGGEYVEHSFEINHINLAEN